MRTRAATLVAGLLCVTVAAQDLPPGVLLLSRIKYHVRQQLAHLEDATCLETIQRFYKPAGRARMQPLDTVRLEILYNGDHEWYASPGARRFNTQDLAGFVGSGAISNGYFALDLKSIFVADQGIFQYRGEESLQGRPAVRWDLRQPQLTSGTTFKMSGVSAIVGERGSFWADPQSLDVLRLELHVDEIPTTLPLEESTTNIVYAPAQIGEHSLMLPQTVEFHVTTTAGDETYNVADFTHCRSFQAASTINFGGSAPLSTPGMPPDAVFPEQQAAGMLPDGLTISVALTAEIDDTASVGSLIEGRVTSDVRDQGKLVVAAGSLLHGRIRRLEHYSDPVDYCAVGLEFNEIESNGSLLRFFADLQQTDPLPGFEWLLANTTTRLISGMQSTVTEKVRLPDLPGVGSFFVRGSHFRLPAGFKLTWKTRPL